MLTMLLKWSMISQGKKNFRLDNYVLDFEEFDFKVGPLFLG